MKTHQFKYVPSEKGKEKLNGFIKLIYKLLGEKEVASSKKVIGIMYNYSEQELTMVRREYLADHNNYYDKQAKGFVTNILSQLYISKESDSGKFSSQELHDNFSKLKIMSFSQGTVFAAMVGSCLVDKMLQHKYPPEEIVSALKKAQLIGIGSAIEFGDTEKTSLFFNTILFTDKNDCLANSTVKKIGKNYVKKISDNIMQVITENPMEFRFYEQGTKTIGTLKDKQYHTPFSYALPKIGLKGEKIDNLSSFMVQNCVINAFVNDEKDITKIPLCLNEKQLKSAFKKVYQERASFMINKAFGTRPTLKEVTIKEEIKIS